MTDRELAERTVQVNQIELAARALLASDVSGPSERASAQDTLRQAVALRRALERWIVSRATSTATQ
jgi:hypothetical protein